MRRQREAGGTYGDECVGNTFRLIIRDEQLHDLIFRKVVMRGFVVIHLEDNCVAAGTSANRHTGGMNGGADTR